MTSNNGVVSLFEVTQFQRIEENNYSLSPQRYRSLLLDSDPVTQGEFDMKMKTLLTELKEASKQASILDKQILASLQMFTQQ